MCAAEDESGSRAPYSIGTYKDSNGFKVKTTGGVLVGWVYPMDYIEGLEGTWGAISEASGEVSDRSLYREGFAGKPDAAAWLLVRWADDTGAPA